MFLRAGAVPGATWIDETIAFVQQSDGARAAVFAPEGLAARVRRTVGLLPRAGQGLIVGKALYDSLRGHRGEPVDAERDLLRRIGRRRLTTLRTTLSQPSV